MTFVFTNQVDGKLVPIESTISSKVQATEGNDNHLKDKRNLYQRTMLVPQQLRKPLDSDCCNQDSIRSNTSTVSCEPLQRTSVKCVRNSLSLKGSVHESLKPKLSARNQLPQKRLSPCTVNCDDDFA